MLASTREVPETKKFETDPREGTHWMGAFELMEMEMKSSRTAFPVSTGYLFALSVLDEDTVRRLMKECV